MMAPRPFTLHVADEVLDDLQQRLGRARFLDLPPHGEPWEYGTDVTYLRELVAYWRDGFYPDTTGNASRG